MPDQLRDAAQAVADLFVEGEGVDDERLEDRIEALRSALSTTPTEDEPEPDVLHINAWFTDEDGIVRAQGPTGTDYGTLDAIIGDWFDGHLEYVQPIQLDFTIRAITEEER